MSQVVILAEKYFFFNGKCRSSSGLLWAYELNQAQVNF